jgi:Protein of unknown function (DUF2934)
MKKETKKPARKTVKASRAATPNQEEMRVAAYYRWIERGSPPGDGAEDWYEAENKWRDNIVPQNND